MTMVTLSPVGAYRRSGYSAEIYKPQISICVT